MSERASTASRAEVRELTIPLPDGVRLHAEVSGADDAPLTVVMLHGWTLSRRIWHRQVEALPGAVDSPVRVIAYDARGHGRSEATPVESATLAQLGDDLAAVLATTAPNGPVVLAGHSLGGMAIMEYAHRHPEDFAARVAGLALVSTTAEGHTHTAYGLPSRLTSLVRAAETNAAWLLARSGAWRPHRALQPVLRPGLRWLLFGDECDPDDLQLTARAVARTSLCAIGGFRPSVGTQARLDTLGALAPLPTAVLVGDRDRLTPVPCAESIAGAVPSAELQILPGAGHMLTLERPDAVTAAIAQVTRQAARGGPGPASTRRLPGRRMPRQRIAPNSISGCPSFA